MTLTLLSSFVGAPQLQIVLLPIGIWMIWAAWAVATATLQRGGWIGGGMVLLSMILEVLLLLFMVIFINPDLMG